MSNNHAFEPLTFRTKFLQPVAKQLAIKETEFIFVVPDNVAGAFRVPEEASDSFKTCAVSVACTGQDEVTSAWLAVLE